MLLRAALLISLVVVCASATDNGYPRCNCEDEGVWSVESILECQRVSDFLIAVAYFSIPIELLYFVSCSNVPFKWVLFQFIAFIVLCGMTHLLNGWTYGPHAFQLAVALTTFKFLTALVSCATAITLITLIPLLLKVKVREFMLKKKTWDLGREVGMIKRQSEAGWHVRMLTHEIRKSLDRHTILHTTMVELSKTLDLQTCAVWMPNENRTEVILTHGLKGRNFQSFSHCRVPYADPDVRKIKERDEVQILRPDSALAVASSGGLENFGAVAAIRMPMLKVSNFKGGTPELMQACYAILVLVLPCGQERSWTNPELEIIKVVADQVAVAISHAAILEESQLMRDQLAEQNRALQQAQRNALMASQARNSFQRVMSHGMRKPMHSVLGLLSVLKDEKLSSEQKLIVDTMMKTGNVLSLLINDVMDDSPKESGRFPSEFRSFGLHALVTEAGCFAKCLCAQNGFGFSIEVDRSLPDDVLGDEKRVFQVILHMVGNLVEHNTGGGSMVLRVYSQHGSQGRNDQRWATWRSGSSDGNVYIRFEVEITNSAIFTDDSALASNYSGPRCSNEIVDRDLSFSVFDAIMRDKMSSYLLDMGFKLPNDTTCKPGQDTSTGEPSTSPSKQNELLPLDLQGKTLCNLLLKDPETLSIYDVGSATAYPPVQNELVHLTAILPGHVKVEIHTIHEEFYGLPLPVPIPTFEIKVLQHGINTFVQWSLSLIKCQTEESLQPKKLKPLSPEIASNDLRSGEATQRTVLVPQMLMESLTPDCQWLATFFDSLPDGEPIAVILDHTIFHFEKDGIAWVNKEDASQFLRGAKLNISIIQVFMRLLQQDLKSKDKAFVVGWLCPEQTCETKIRKSLHETHDYVFKAVSKSVENGAKFIMAPIFQEEHWMILVICVPTCTIYQFDSARPTTTRRNVKMKTIVSFFFTRFKLNGNRVNRKEPLRKLVKCAQQRGGTECGFYTMRYMYDILSKYSEANDIDEVCMSLNEDP